MRINYASITLRKPVLNKQGNVTGHETATAKVVCTGSTTSEVQQFSENLSRVLNIRKWEVKEEIKDWKVTEVKVITDLGERILPI